MTIAQNAPVKRSYNRREVHSEDVPLTHRADVNLGEDLSAPVIHTEALPKMGDSDKDTSKAKWYADIAFNEEPVTIMIEENSRSDFPETHVPVAVNGKNAEIFVNGGWVEVGWLPIGVQLTTKRKYVEQLLRSKSESVRTEHEDATVERPRNTLKRRNTANYPVSILHDANPLSAQWLTRVRMEH